MFKKIYVTWVIDPTALNKSTLFQLNGKKKENDSRLIKF